MTRSITLTVCESLDSKSLPFQVIIKERRKDRSQSWIFPMVFVYPTMKKTVRLIEQVLVPYIKKLKKEKYLPNNQKSPYMGHI